jgi:SAM-dependent methyltransferase
MSSFQVLRGFLKTIRADRALGAATDCDAKVFDKLYQNRSDPWGLNGSPLSQYRYLAVLGRIAPFAPCARLLDVGCGEGLFTRYLSAVAHEVVGIDISPAAIERAGRSGTRATFQCTPLQEFRPPQPFDVVVVAEVLYYADDKDAAIRHLASLGRTVIVSYSRARAPQVEPALERSASSLDRTFHGFFGSTTHGFTIASFKGDVDADHSSPTQAAG